MAEKEQAASGYIVSFFSDIEQLLSYYAAYKSQIIKTSLRTGNDKAKMTDVEKESLSQLSENTKFLIFRTYIKFFALKEQVQEFKKPKYARLTELYNILKEEASPDSGLVEEYCFEINKVFVDGIAATILVKARELYEQYLK